MGRGLRQRLGLWIAGASPAPVMRAAYRGASTTRLTNDWYPSALSADQEIKASGRLLRVRSRQLCRDNPHAAGFLMTLRDNVIGTDQCGIGLQARNPQPGGPGFDRGLNEEIERAFEAWGVPEICTVEIGRAHV